MIPSPDPITPTIYSRDQHAVSRNGIDPDALKIMYRLIRNGFKAYMVGGGVRDLLLGKKPKDIDIATDATPRRIKALFRNSRIIGRRFKLVHIFFGGGKVIEVSTFRDFSDPIEPEAEEGDENKETEGTNGKMPFLGDNKYGTESTDALRRDLTINGLFYDLSSYSIIDYVGGMKDLIDGVIRVIGDPEERFIEDPVRMLRAVRHAAKNNFTIQQDTLKAITIHRERIVQSPAMRVFEELKKDLTSGHLLNILRSLASTELLEFLLPEIVENIPCLFQETSFLSKYLKAVDERSMDEEAPSSSVVLALMVLAQKLDISPELDAAEEFSDYERLLEYLRSRFKKLAVPRKEREKIQALLSLWAYLLTVPEDRFKNSRLRLHDMQTEARDFLEIAGMSKDLIKAFNIANEGHRARKEGDMPMRRNRNRRSRRQW